MSANDVTVSFTPLQEATGIDIVDPIERHHFSLRTPGTVTTPLDHRDPDRFYYPVDAAVSLHAESITLPTVVITYVHTEEDGIIASVEPSGKVALDPDCYYVELAGPIKTYLKVESAVTIRSDTETTEIEFGDETPVQVGARSLHERPATTVTTTGEPEAMMQALSTFGSALKTHSPERSFPTLRGHPPTIELGDDLRIPEQLSAPVTGVELVLPPELSSVYVGAPLAYYLGATMVPGDRPRLQTTDGFTYPLGGMDEFETAVERVLKQVFVLDCVTRTEGYYPVTLTERDALAPKLDLEFDELYAQPLTDRLREYLTVPYELVEPQVPQWPLMGYVTPTPESVEVLPYLVDDLAIVRSPRTDDAAQADVDPSVINDYLRGETFTRSARSSPVRSTRSSSTPDRAESYVQPESTTALYQAWFGDDTPVGANKLLQSAFQNRLERPPSNGAIGITVVCNDSAMEEEEDAIDAIYGSRSELPFDVQVHTGLSTAELASVLQTPTDFLHFIGHTDDGGFRCTDGLLDAGDLDAVGVDAFLLNTCQSYRQGCELIDAGAIGGVVTLSDVVNSGAVRIGQTMARLLNGGFPLQAALKIARNRSVIGGQYLVVGDGSFAVTQPEGSIPSLTLIESREDDYLARVKSFPTDGVEIGTLVMPRIESVETYNLGSNTTDGITMTGEELRSFLRLADFPVRLDGDLRWSSDLAAELD